MPKTMEAADLYEIKLTLMYLEPAIWRRVTEAPSSRIAASLCRTEEVRMQHIAAEPLIHY